MIFLFCSLCHFCLCKVRVFCLYPSACFFLFIKGFWMHSVGCYWSEVHWVDLCAIALLCLAEVKANANRLVLYRCHTFQFFCCSSGSRSLCILYIYLCTSKCDMSIFPRWFPGVLSGLCSHGWPKDLCWYDGLSLSSFARCKKESMDRVADVMRRVEMQKKKGGSK